MSALAERTSLERELLAQLAQLEILDDEWLRVSFGPTVPSGAWTTSAALLAVDGEGLPGAGLAHLVERIAAATPGVEPSLVWSTVHLQPLWGLTDLNAKLLAGAGRIVRIDPTEIRFLVDVVGPEPSIRGLHLRIVRLTVAPDDPFAGRTGVEVLDEDQLARRFADDLVAVAAPFVEAVRARVKIGRRALWGQVLDALVHPFAERRPGDAGPGDAKRRVERVTAALDGTPLGQPVQWVDFDHREEPRCALRSTACCLAYKWPAEPGRRRTQGGDPQWDRYCQSCPLIPVEETVHRARFWIDQHDRPGAVGPAPDPSHSHLPPPEVPS